MRRLLLGLILLLAAPAAASAQVAYQGYPWNVFDGSGRLGQHWSASHVHIQGNLLTETISGGVAGGIGMRHYQAYGSYRVTFRMTRGGGKYCILLFGKTPHDEIDFAEDKPFDSNRSVMTGTLHWGASNEMIHAKTSGDFSQWHTAGLDWRPGRLTFTLDGRVWAEMTSHVPSSPMHMTIQTSAHGGGASTLEVSSVQISP